MVSVTHIMMLKTIHFFMSFDLLLIYNKRLFPYRFVIIKLLHNKRHLPNDKYRLFQMKWWLSDDLTAVDNIQSFLRWLTIEATTTKVVILAISF